MQWKLLRDELANLSERMITLNQRVDELNMDVDNHKQEREAGQIRLRNDLKAGAEECTRQVKLSVDPVAEQIEAMFQMVYAERTARDMSKSMLEREIRDVYTSMEEDRVAGRKQKVRTKSLIHDYGIAISDESNARILFERRHARSIDKLHERIDFKSSSSASVIQDLSEQVQLVGEKTSREMSSYATQVVGHQNAVDAVCEAVRDTDAQFGARLGRIEEMLGIHASSWQSSEVGQTVQNLLGSAPSMQSTMQPTLQSTMQSTTRSVSPPQTHESPPKLTIFLAAPGTDIQAGQSEFNAEIGVLESAALAPNMPQATVACQVRTSVATARMGAPMAVRASGSASASVVVAQPVGSAAASVLVAQPAGIVS